MIFKRMLWESFPTSQLLQARELLTSIAQHLASHCKTWQESTDCYEQHRHVQYN